ncbi:bile acid:sodium symporter [Planctomycetota bacterium]|nr:bile acid:sodium symporter [Planctomycetota bacterium]
MSLWFKRHWFVIGLVLAVAVGALWPALGANDSLLFPKVSIHLAIAVAFAIVGLTLPTTQLRSAIGLWKGHLAIQVFSFAVMPALAWLVAAAVEPLDPGLATGVRILGCLPTTIATAALFTRTAGGDEALALCNTTLGNLVGVVVTPALIVLIAERSGALDLGGAIAQIARDVVVPFAIGQSIRWPWVRRSGEPPAWLRQIPNVCVLIIVLLVFAGSVNSGGFEVGASLALAFGAAAVLFSAGSLFAWWWAGWRGFGLGRGQRIAVLFCASQKTLAVGVPLIAVLFAGDPRLALLTLPVLLYHLVQLVAGGIIAARMAAPKGKA